ncbi:MAG: outer membrane beta-barrel protein [Fluviicola sp.]
MKKLILPVLAIMSLGTATAQFNLGVSVGYGLGSPGHVLGTTTATNGDQKNIYGTLGNGIQANLTPGYMLGEHFGIELGLNGFFGSETTIDKSESLFGTDRTTQKSTQFRIAPAFYIRSGGEKFSVYARTGLLIPLLGSVKTERNDDSAFGLSVLQVSSTSGKVALGYTGAFGFNIHFGQKFGFFAEVGANSLRVKSKTTEVKTSTVNGNDQLESTPEYFKEITYVDELNSSSNNFGYNSASSPTSAREELRQVANFSNFFVQIGIKFTFTGD